MEQAPRAANATREAVAARKYPENLSDARKREPSVRVHHPALRARAGLRLAPYTCHAASRNSVAIGPLVRHSNGDSPYNALVLARGAGCFALAAMFAVFVVATWLFVESGALDGPDLIALNVCCPQAAVVGAGCAVSVLFALLGEETLTWWCEFAMRAG